MINAMRTLALDYLIDKLGDKDNINENPERWYRELRNTHPEQLFPFLVEGEGNIEKVYSLYPDMSDSDVVNMAVEDMTAEKVNLLPFMKPTGSQSAQVGPVIKRTYLKDNGPGPSSKILATTMGYFRELSGSNKPWSNYFLEIVRLLKKPKLRLLDNAVINWKESNYSNILIAAVASIGEQKKTVILTIKDTQGRYPGQRPEYLNYLMTEKLGGTRYTTEKAPKQDNEICPLCGSSGITVFPNALPGAGINLCNVDREGAFPGIDTRTS